MGTLKKMYKGIKIITADGLARLKDSGFGEEVLVKLYYNSNDPIQKALIEELCRVKGYTLVVETDPEPLMTA